MVLNSARIWAAVAALWPMKAQAHPDVATDVGIMSYVLATAATMVLLLAVLLLPRLSRLIASPRWRRLAPRAAGREANDA